MSKLGLHVISWNQSAKILDFIARAKPAVVKVMEFNEMDMDAARASSPGTFWVGRQYVQDQPLDDPAENAKWFMSQLQPAIDKVGKRIDAWESYNEVVLNTPDEARAFNEFTVEWASLMHAQGLKCAAFSFSTGTPEFDLWQYLAEGARACDYLALHEYDHPQMDTTAGYLCLRYRKIRDLLPPDAQRPILITECGIDDGNGNGWLHYVRQGAFLSQLSWYDHELMKDEYVIGATIFTIDGRMWKTFDVLPLLNPLANYVASTPTPAPVTLPTEPTASGEAGSAAGQEATPPGVGSTPSADEGARQPDEQTVYLVQSGDTLSAIARKFNTTVSALVAANQLANPNRIRVGQRLVIPR